MHFWALFSCRNCSIAPACEHNWSVQAWGEEQPRVALAKRWQLFEVLEVIRNDFVYKRRSVEASKRRSVEASKRRSELKESKHIDVFPCQLGKSSGCLLGA